VYAAAAHVLLSLTCCCCTAGPQQEGAIAAHVNMVDRYGAPAITKAAINGHTSTIDRLLKYDSVVDCKDKSGYTPLKWAAVSNKADVVSSLLKHKADPNGRVQPAGAMTALAAAAEYRCAEVIFVLMGHPETQIEAMDKNGNTALMIAARKGYPECVQLLMHGADANAKGSHGKTALQLAQDFKHSPACPESRKPEYKKAIQLLKSWKSSMLTSWKRKMSISEGNSPKSSTGLRLWQAKAGNSLLASSSPSTASRSRSPVRSSPAEATGGSKHASVLKAAEGSTIMGHGSQSLGKASYQHREASYQHRPTFEKMQQGLRSKQSSGKTMNEKQYEIQESPAVVEETTEVVEQSTEVSPRSMREQRELLRQHELSRSPKREAEQRPLSLEFLLQIFDEVDEDGTEFASRLDLRLKVDTHIKRDPRAQSLSNAIRALDCMIMERDDFIDMVNDWLEIA